MDATEELLRERVNDETWAEIVYTRAGVALPREARARPRIGAQQTAASPLSQTGRARRDPVRYEARAFSGRAARYTATLEEAYRLRARVFMGELGWLAPSADGRERDRCDSLARHFVVYAGSAETSDGGEPAPDALVGYARVLLPRHGFMLQREFAELTPAQPGERFMPDARRAFEVSRFVVRPAHRGRRCVEGRTVVEHLARAIASWALEHGRTDWYTVCEARYLRALRLRGLRFTQLGRAVEYQPGVEACAALLRLPVASAELRASRAHDYAWYTRPLRERRERRQMRGSEA
ncbi:MAG: acyl-homoserine-lactone synthase [Ktedonobacterales bacterium]|jgi:N-acyl-L-homoserine lactone synthetase